MKKKIINVIMVVAIIAVAFFNVDINVTKGHSIVDLNSIFHSVIANAEDGGGDGCQTITSDYFTESGGCQFKDHAEWCEGNSGTCFYEQYQYRMCPPGDWEMVCYEAGAHNC